MGKALSDKTVAKIWERTEEGMSQREVAADLNIAPASVSKYLGEDPVRLEGLRAREREIRSRVYKQLESTLQRGALKWARLIESAAPTDLVALDKMSIKRLKRLSLVPGVLRAAITGAEKSTKLHQLLTGGPTDRIEQTGDGDDAPTAEAIIAIARDLKERGIDVTMMLPGPLRKHVEG